MSLVYLCLVAASLPWLLFLLRRFSGQAQILPSLIFFYEQKGGRLPPWRRYITYLLQSLFFLMLASYFYSGLRFSQHQLFCLVDDHLRSTILPSQWQSWQKNYGDICNYQFYSAAALAENRLELLGHSLSLKGNPPLAANHYLAWLPQLSAQAILFFTREDNFLWLGEARQQDLFLYAEPAKVLQNYFFEKISVVIDPLDYRKRLLRIQTQPQVTVLVERWNNRQTAIADNQGFLEIQLSMPEKVGLEILRLVLPKDEQAADNLALIALLWYDPVALSGSALPKSIVALQQISDFPYYPFRIKSPRQLKVQLAQCAQSTLAFLSADEEVFARLPVYSSCSAEKVNQVVLLKFRDGRPAVTAASGMVQFWFDPDKVPEDLLYHPAYSLLLAETLYLAAAPVVVQQEEVTSSIMDYPMVRLGRQIIKEAAFLPMSEAVAINYSFKAVQVSKEKIPAHKIIAPGKEKTTAGNPLWLAAAFTFFFFTFVLQFPWANN